MGNDTANTTDPIASIRRLLMDVCSEEDLDPTMAMTAMVQVAAQISYDIGKQKELSDNDSADMWLGGCTLAFCAASGLDIQDRLNRFKRLRKKY